MTIIQIGKKFYTFPDRWNDLSKRQLLAIMDILANQKDIIVREANAKFFKILSGASWFRLLLNKRDVLENIHLVEWIYDMQPAALMTKNILPKYAGWYGPADEMMNMVALEFFWAQHFHDKWAATQEVENLNMMVATLYRPGKKGYDTKLNPDGDLRERYNNNLTELYSKVVAKWPMSVKEAIAKWFEHNYLALRNKYPEVFEGGGDPSRFGFVSLLRGVAERGVHGNFHTVENMNIHLLFIELSEVLIKDRKLD